MKLTKNVTVTIRDSEIVGLLARALYPKSAVAEGKDKILFLALSNLIGCSDLQAVKIANREADRRGLPRIKADEFRRWLPTILSEAFDEYMKGGSR